MRLNRVKITQGSKELTVMVGRKRKTGKRYPGGQLVKQKALTPAQVAATMPHRIGIPADRRHDQRAENPLGALNLIGAISVHQYDAGLKYRDIVRRYRAVIESPNPNPAALSLDRIAAGGRFPISDEEAKRRTEEYCRAFECVTGYGPRVVVKSVVIYEKPLQPGDLKDLCTGLDALVKHFGLLAAGKRMAR